MRCSLLVAFTLALSMTGSADAAPAKPRAAVTRRAAKPASKRAKAAPQIATERATKPRAKIASKPRVRKAKIAVAPLDEKEIAKRTVFDAVKDALPATQKLTNLRVNVLPFAGNAKNPITGTSIYRVYANQSFADGIKPTFWQRMKQRFSKYRERSFDVKVCGVGTACVFGVQSYTPTARLGRWFDRNLPIRAFVSDLISSGKAKEIGGWLTAGSVGAFVNPAFAVAAAPFVFDSIKKARTEARLTRERTLDGAIAWADQYKADKGEFPTLAQTYERYKEDLAPTGYRPLSGFDFAQKLSLKGY